MTNATFFVADVQGDDLRGPYDRAFSRFGTMFFALPGAALRNIRRALAPGGELTMIVWRRREDNAWLHEAERRVKTILPVVSTERPIRCTAGRVLLDGRAGPRERHAASRGLRPVTFERYDADICIGSDLDEAVEFAMNIGPAGEVIRLAGEEGGEVGKPQVVAALRETFAPLLSDPDGVTDAVELVVRDGGRSVRDDSAPG